nr:MAG TPA: hypothetical protein [Caudoviricetes sp.]
MPWGQRVPFPGCTRIHPGAAGILCRTIGISASCAICPHLLLSRHHLPKRTVIFLSLTIQMPGARNPRATPGARKYLRYGGMPARRTAPREGGALGLLIIIALPRIPAFRCISARVFGGGVALHGAHYRHQIVVSLGARVVRLGRCNVIADERLQTPITGARQGRARLHQYLRNAGQQALHDGPLRVPCWQHSTAAGRPHRQHNQPVSGAPAHSRAPVLRPPVVVAHAAIAPVDAAVRWRLPCPIAVLRPLPARPPPARRANPVWPAPPRNARYTPFCRPHAHNCTCPAAPALRACTAPQTGLQNAPPLPHGSCHASFVDRGALAARTGGEAVTDTGTADGQRYAVTRSVRNAMTDTASPWLPPKISRLPATSRPITKPTCPPPPGRENTATHP